MLKIRKSTRRPRPAGAGPWWYIATWFGSGQSPKASGTAGSLAALPFAYVIQHFGGNLALLGAAVGIFFVGWWASNRYLAVMGGAQDPSEIVVDEVAGMWLLLAFMPLTWQSYVVGFFLFRAFDVVKPWPVSLSDEKIKGGLGVMLDDIWAGLYPVGIYYFLQLLNPAISHLILSFLESPHV
ncbi:MAG: phosphatidylglycerophosphatase A [Alphaproteobacteria bacterium]|nr:phosphatidylglycerophosphatase A [Alphaproteobacteria bacterium]